MRHRYLTMCCLATVVALEACGGSGGSVPSGPTAGTDRAAAASGARLAGVAETTQASGITPQDTAYTISAPSVPLPERSPQPLCVGGRQYKFALGDDFTQETQAQLDRYTTAWDINAYEANGAETNWAWSDQYSGIGRRNDYGAGDTYMVHVDAADSARSYPASWVNTISPRPGNRIEGSPPYAYLDIKAVAVPSQYVNDSRLLGAHWLTGALQSGKFTFGYTETTALMPSQNGAWAAVWQLQVPGGGGYDGTGTSSTNYWEIDTLEKFGNILGSDVVQQTTNSGRSNAAFVRPQTIGATTAYHTYGQLWVPPAYGKPAYIVFYVDRKPTSKIIAPTGVGDMNMNVNLQMGSVGSYVGTPDKSKVAELRLKNYFTWQPTGASCDSTALHNPIPTPSPTGTPVAPPPVASDIVPKLRPYLSPVEVLSNTTALTLASMPAYGDLLVAQGVSQYAQCPHGFAYAGAGDAYLCTAIVGKNGVVAAESYPIGGYGFRIGALVDVHDVSSFALVANMSSGWSSSPTPSLTTSRSVPGSGELALAFGYDITSAPRYPTAVKYSSNHPFNTIYESKGDSAYGSGMAMLETSVDAFGLPGKSVSYSGSYAWAGPAASNGTDLYPAIYTVLVK